MTLETFTRIFIGGPVAAVAAFIGLRALFIIVMAGGLY